MPCTSLYIHVPFCVSKCPYCDFYSVPYEGVLADAYTSRICSALKSAPFSLQPLETVYFGGGTPSLLGGERIERILDAARRFGIRDDAEITVECNPGDVDEARLRRLWQAGVNRLSIGLQSADEELLQMLHRRHTPAQARETAQWARKVGFSELSFDLMLALPGQTEESILRSVRFCRAQGAVHVSAYLLKLEPGTPFDTQQMRAACPDEDTQAALYQYAVRALESHGYEQYEISNFAQGGLIARHNFKYWDGQEYLGLGPAAHSFVEGRRFSFPRDLQAFLTTEDVFTLCEEEGPGGEADEYLMLRLRLIEGVVWEALEARYPGKGMRAALEEGAALLDGLGLVETDERGVRLTQAGLLVSNSVIGMLIP